MEDMKELETTDKATHHLGQSYKKPTRDLLGYPHFLFHDQSIF